MFAGIIFGLLWETAFVFPESERTLIRSRTDLALVECRLLASDH